MLGPLSMQGLPSALAVRLLATAGLTPLSAPPEGLSPASPRGSRSPDTPVRSNSISCAVSPPKSATSAILRRRWGTPQYCASCTRQATLHRPSTSRYPPQVGQPFAGTSILGASGSTRRIVSSSTAAKSRPLLLLSAPGTFSHTMYLGRISSPDRPSCLSCSRISFITLICSINRPLRAPARPARLPAMLRSWHGLPPVTHHTGSMVAPSIFVMSPMCCIMSRLRTPATPRGSCPPSGGKSRQPSR